MKYTAVLLATAAGLAAAQSPADYFPSCALPGLQTGIAATSCGATDYACQCTADNQKLITGAATAAIIAACGQDVAINQVLPAASKFCAAVAAAGSGTTAAATTSAAATTAAGTTSAAGSSSAKSTTSAAATTSGKSTVTTAVSSTAAPTHASNSTSTSVPVTAGGAVAGSIGTLAMAVLGALAAF